MSDLTRQQLCAELAISESTVRRLEHAGLPYTAIGKRTKRYHLEECKTWLRRRYQPGERLQVEHSSVDLHAMGNKLAASIGTLKLRVKPS